MAVQMQELLRIDEDSSGGVVLFLLGKWSIREGGLIPERVWRRLQEKRGQDGLRFCRVDMSEVETWDSSLVVFVRQIAALASCDGVSFDGSALPDGVRSLLAMAGDFGGICGEKEPVGDGVSKRLWAVFCSTSHRVQSVLAFVGELTMSLGRLAVGRAQMRGTDLLVALQDCSSRALPIVSLLSFLTGLIMAFVGAIQLQQFGAEIYVADLVGLAVVREMGALMVGIIMAGRTGAAFAASISAMQGNEEVDALSTFGISPVDFLVLPRLLALFFMMPLLCVYSDVLGILGGVFVAMTMLDVSLPLYLWQTTEALNLADVMVGIIKSIFYGFIIAATGCFKGLYAGRNAVAVGKATTSAVVTAIVWIIVVDAVFQVVCHILDF